MTMHRRRSIVIGNWKMNGRMAAGVQLARELVQKSEIKRPEGCDVVICPPATILWPVSEVIMGSPILLGGQDCHTANHGMYTGDISAGMLLDVGCRYVLLGHSERRRGHNEDDALIARKVTAAQLAGLTTIVCVGEPEDVRARGEAADYVSAQVRHALPTSLQATHLIVAYEPVWAIGSDQTASVSDITAMHKTIRQALGTLGDAVRVVYGGSVTPSTAPAITLAQGVDGLLVGAASLNADGFWAIVETAAKT